MENYPVKYLTKKRAKELNIDLSRFPNFSASGSVTGMKKLYYGPGAKLVRSGSYIYNVSEEPEIYDLA